MRDSRSARYSRLFILAAMTAFVTACAKDPPRQTSYFSDYASFDLTTSPDFADYRNVVGSYLSRKAPGADTTACVIGLTRGARDTEAVWVIWRDGNRFIRWFAGEDDLALSSRDLSLIDDVVPTDADIGTSTYLESRGWVEALERRCEQDGHRVAGIG